MGMFDCVVCDYALPGDVPEFARNPGYQFQTKSFDSMMDTYTIREDGSLWRLCHHDKETKSVSFTGVVNFYGSNIVGGGPGIYTSNGEDARSVEYEATFFEGKLTRIVEIENTQRPALPMQVSYQLVKSKKNIDREKKEWEKRTDESLLDREIYVFWGGQDQGYWATVVAEDDRRLCVRGEKLELIEKALRDCIFFDSEEEAWESRRERREDWDRRQKMYDDYCQEWEKKRKGEK